MPWTRIENAEAEIIPAYAMCLAREFTTTTGATEDEYLLRVYKPTTAKLVAQEQYPYLVINGSADIAIGGRGVGTMYGPALIAIPQALGFAGGFPAAVEAIVPTPGQWYGSFVFTGGTGAVPTGYTRESYRHVWSPCGPTRALDPANGKFAVWAEPYRPHPPSYCYMDSSLAQTGITTETTLTFTSNSSSVEPRYNEKGVVADFINSQMTLTPPGTWEFTGQVTARCTSGAGAQGTLLFRISSPSQGAASIGGNTATSPVVNYDVPFHTSMIYRIVDRTALMLRFLPGVGSTWTVQGNKRLIAKRIGA